MSTVVTLLTDFGTRDTYVAEMKGVLSASPRITLVDLSHHVPSYSVRWGAFLLWRAYSSFPKGSWHLAVVDPGVGTARRALYVKAGPYHFVGPDNGLLTWAVRDAEKKARVKAKAFEIPIDGETGPTFHGRDVFAPFVLKSLKGTSKPKTRAVKEFSGEDFPKVRHVNKDVIGEVIGVDHFGNIVTSVPFEGMKNVQAHIKDRMTLRMADNYLAIPPGNAALIRGSHGLWEISCRMGSASEMLRLVPGDPVTFTAL